MSSFCGERAGEILNVRLRDVMFMELSEKLYP